MFEILWGIVETIQFTLSDKHLDGAGRSPRYFLDKFKEWHILVLQMMSFDYKKSNYMQGLKNAILAIFSDRAGIAVPC